MYYTKSLKTLVSIESLETQFFMDRIGLNAKISAKGKYSVWNWILKTAIRHRHCVCTLISSLLNSGNTLPVQCSSTGISQVLQSAILLSVPFEISLFTLLL